MRILYPVYSFFDARTRRRKARTKAESRVLNLIARMRPWQTNRPLIRLGPPSDGGYLIPDDLEGIEACFSPGVGLISGFEADCAARGLKVFLADGSVKEPAQTDPNFKFINKHIGLTSTDTTSTMDDWVNSSCVSHNSDLMLQMDIEGFEWLALANMSGELLNRFRILMVEFHGLDQLQSVVFFCVASNVFQRILETHVCVHIHPNNCSKPLPNPMGIVIPSVMEFTFLRKDRVSTQTPAKLYPHPLDCDNAPVNKPLPLPEIWYQDPQDCT